jgi:hypothetical protein
MIGSRLTDDRGAEFEVVGQRGGMYVIQRQDEHEPPQEVTAAELGARFKIDATPPPVPDEQAGWEVLADGNDRAALRLTSDDGPTALSPEEQFASHEGR